MFSLIFYYYLFMFQPMFQNRSHCYEQYEPLYSSIDNISNMKTIEFEIIYNPNPQIHQNGYVEVPLNEDETVEWYFYNQSGMTQPREFTHHDGIGITQIGATEEQQAEIDKFLEIVHVDLVDWVQDVIVLSEEDENDTYTKGDLTIHVNDG